MLLVGVTHLVVKYHLSASFFNEGDDKLDIQPNIPGKDNPVQWSTNEERWREKSYSRNEITSSMLFVDR